MLLVLWIIVGILTGSFVGRFLTDQRDLWRADALLGILGSVVGGQVSLLTERVRGANSAPGSVYVAIAGAIVTVVVFRLLVRRRNT